MESKFLEFLRIFIQRDVHFSTFIVIDRLSYNFPMNYQSYIRSYHEEETSSSDETLDITLEITYFLHFQINISKSNLPIEFIK